MNKIFKILAVFMLFSTLAAGSMTVQADETNAVAQIGSTTYTSLAAAIAEANNATTAVEIDLLTAVELTEAITINSNVTLDLNGCTLTTSSSITVAPDGNVVDNSSGKDGLLKLGDSSTINWTSNSQVPVYNTEKEGYAFATMTEQVYRESEMGADTFELIFKPDFGAVNNLMAQGSIATKVDIGICLEWTDANGASKTAELVYDETMDEMVKTVYTADSGYAFYIKATGATKFDNLTITPTVKSELGTTWSKTVFECNDSDEYDGWFDVLYGRGDFEEENPATWWPVYDGKNSQIEFRTEGAQSGDTYLYLGNRSRVYYAYNDNEYKPKANATYKIVGWVKQDGENYSPLEVAINVGGKWDTHVINASQIGVWEKFEIEFTMAAKPSGSVNIRLSSKTGITGGVSIDGVKYLEKVSQEQ